MADGYTGVNTSSDRSVMHLLYGLHTVAPFTLWSLSVVALIVNYIRRADETDAFTVAHHSYMIRTFWWAILWLVLTVPLWFLFVVPGYIAWVIIGCWYLYRCIRGWLRFNDNRLPP
ncbi:hypothetical protein HHL11_28475 [Ramlibacter sp. G-1-2-2]|uniref:DUF4870 domain-containing protein n=1 Tax=Ramlibacter agri TaxID=2728837 RepID=A0A848HE11_9BURK|nr:hypothetical protein [Ramlibacter agri]NML47719.1 hypothetical protein [Ramlibacter agri]